MSAGFRPVPTGRPIVWREDFGTRFTVFVDTEESFDWNGPFRHDGWSVAAMTALPAAHARLVGHGVAMAYLIDYPIATEPAAIEAIRAIMAQGSVTIGTQLHPWVNPPFDEIIGVRNSFAGNLPPALEAAKLDRLGDAIAAITGERPVVYRAGRYGLGPATLALLAARGYRIDSSMRAGYSYAAHGGPDFRRIGNAAFREGSILELPLTTVFTGMLRRGGQRWYDYAAALPHGPGVMARSGLLNRVSLTPEGMPLAEACEAIRVAVGEGTRLLNLSFHSPSIVPGHTPYVRDAADLATFWAWWDGVLDLFDRLGVRSASVAEVLAAAA